MVAAVVTVAGASLDPESVFEICRRGLEANFVPSYLQVLEEIPKTASEKHIERFLVERFAPDAEDVYTCD